MVIQAVFWELVSPLSPDPWRTLLNLISTTCHSVFVPLQVRMAARVERAPLPLALIPLDLPLRFWHRCTLICVFKSFLVCLKWQKDWQVPRILGCTMCQSRHGLVFKVWYFSGCLFRVRDTVQSHSTQIEWILRYHGVWAVATMNCLFQ